MTHDLSRWWNKSFLRVFRALPDFFEKRLGSLKHKHTEIEASWEVFSYLIIFVARISRIRLYINSWVCNKFTILGWLRGLINNMTLACNVCSVTTRFEKHICSGIKLEGWARRIILQIFYPLEITFRWFSLCQFFIPGSSWYLLQGFPIQYFDILK